MFLALGFAICGIIAIDMHVPSLPHIAEALHATTTLTKFTISIYMLGLTISPLIFGPIADRFGRRPILLFSIIFSIIGFGLAFISPNIYCLLVARFVQAFALGAGIGMIRAMSRDLFDGKELTQVSSWISLAISTGPSLAPLLGNFLQIYFGWRSVFLFLGLYSLLFGILIILFVPETIPEKNSDSTKIKTIFKNYNELISNRYYMANLICTGAGMGGIICFYTEIPFLLKNHFHLSQMYFGWIISSITIMTFFSRSLNVVLARFFEARVALISGLSLMFTGSLMLLFGAIFHLDYLFLLIISMMFYLFGTGLVFPNAFSEAIRPFGKIGGSAAALYASFQMGTAFLAGGVTSILENGELYLGLILLILSGGAMLNYFLNIPE